MSTISKPALSISAIGRNWKGGRRIDGAGYIEVWHPDHPRANRGYVEEHILIGEAALGRYLEGPHCIHHFDENRTNNSNSNLVICEDTAYHSLLHARQRVLFAGGDPDIHKICMSCRSVKSRTDFCRNRGRGDGLDPRCKDCMNRSSHARYRKTHPIQRRSYYDH